MLKKLYGKFVKKTSNLKDYNIYFSNIKQFEYE